MPKTRPADPAEFRRQMVDLVRAARDPSDLARECEPARQTLQTWVAEADRSEGRREAKPPLIDPGLTATERDELARLRREVRQLKLERDPEGAPSGVKSPRERAADPKARLRKLRAEPRALPAPGSAEARIAFDAACREHGKRIQFADGYVELKRTPLTWLDGGFPREGDGERGAHASRRGRVVSAGNRARATHG